MCNQIEFNVNPEPFSFTAMFVLSAFFSCRVFFTVLVVALLWLGLESNRLWKLNPYSHWEITYREVHTNKNINMEIKGWDPASNLSLLVFGIACFIVPFACCMICSSICRLLIPEEIGSTILINQQIDEERESTTMSELDYRRKSIGIYHV